MMAVASFDPDDAVVVDESAASTASEDRDWTALVEQYQPLINSVCRRLRLGADDTADVSQNVWMSAYQHLHTLRDPKALPGWIKTTTSRAAYDLLRQRDRVVLIADHRAAERSQWPWQTSSQEDEVDAQMLRDERQTAVRSGVAELSRRNRKLLGMLVADPPVSYERIGAQLGMPVGSIGPTRARCLGKLASTAPIRALTDEAA